jgi:glycosyltransferase involved in cell wall biosynthesis
MSGPKVTIGIPTRNRAALLERALQSALAQEGVEVEVVVSDNASTDGTPALCEAMAAADGRLKVLRHDVDIGAERNFRSVLDAASGSRFMWLADDDWIDPGYVAACVAVLEEHPDYALVCGRGRYYREGSYAFSERPVNLLSGSSRTRLLGFYRTVGHNFPFYGVMRRALLVQTPIAAGLASDWLLVAGIAWSGKIRTIEAVSIHRSLEGASGDPASLARAYEIPAWKAWHVHLAVGARVCRDVWSASSYAETNQLERLALGAVCGAIVVVRGWPRWMVALALAKLGWLEHVHGRLEERRRSRERLTPPDEEGSPPGST